MADRVRVDLRSRVVYTTENCSNSGDTMRFEIGGHYHMSVDEFWEDVFFDADFNDYLHLTGLKFRGYEILDADEQPDGRRSRVLRAQPNVPIPMAPLQRLCSAAELRTSRMVASTRSLEAGKPMCRFRVWRISSQSAP